MIPSRGACEICKTVSSCADCRAYKRERPMEPEAMNVSDDYTVVPIKDGYAIRGDSRNVGVQQATREITGPIGLLIADPPYGNVLKKVRWDKVKVSAKQYALEMNEWLQCWRSHMTKGGAVYVWGGTGTPGFRPFFHLLCEAEEEGAFELAMLITWKKRRAYGVPKNYLFTREECAYFVCGAANQPAKFHVPLLAQERGYAGYNKGYPAKSEFLRRGAVWTDINEIFKGKVHDAQKPEALAQVMIETHTDAGDWVVDPFAGSGSTALAARKLGRRFVVIENDDRIFDEMVERLK